MTEITQSFIDALGRLETGRDVDAIANLFAAGAEIANPLVQYEDGGAEAARTFWSQYRDAFDEIRSEFRTVSDQDGVSFLEWTSSGSVDGKAFAYEGVSILETEGDKIRSFRTYFDTRHIPTARKGGGEGSGRVQLSGANGGQEKASKQNDGREIGGKQGGSDGADAMVEAQRDAADQRAGGGYS